MKRIIASAGLAALGAASMQAAYTPGLTPMEQAKPWSISLAVRGFYDDNYATQADDLSRDSFGVSVNPTAALNTTVGSTLISASYNYDLRWYEDRDQNEADHIQVANLKVTHGFTESLKLEVFERFVYAQEGTITMDGPVSTRTVLFTDADYARNTAGLTFKGFFGERFGLEIGYKNELWDYEQDAESGVLFNSSRSALLDRMDHLGTIEFLVRLSEPAIGLIGYKLGISQHTSEADNVPVPVGPYIYQMASADFRDYLSHYAYVGIDYTFNPKLNASLRVGAQITDYVNVDDVESYSGYEAEDMTYTPYVDARLTYNYNPGSYVMIGVIDTISQTDLSSQSEQSIAVYGNVSHRITPPWSAGLVAMFQHSTFTGGYGLDGESEIMYLAGINSVYRFSQYLSAELGYNYDRLDSDLESREYDRNRVYVGLRATF